MPNRLFLPPGAFANPGDPPQVIRVGDDCYELIGDSDQHPTVPDFETSHETCEDCEETSGSGSSGGPTCDNPCHCGDCCFSEGSKWEYVDIPTLSGTTSEAQAIAARVTVLMGELQPFSSCGSTATDWSITDSNVYPFAGVDWTIWMHAQYECSPPGFNINIILDRVSPGSNLTIYSGGSSSDPGCCGDTFTLNQASRTEFEVDGGNSGDIEIAIVDNPCCQDCNGNCGEGDDTDCDGTCDDAVPGACPGSPPLNTAYSAAITANILRCSDSSVIRAYPSSATVTDGGTFNCYWSVTGTDSGGDSFTVHVYLDGGNCRWKAELYTAGDIGPTVMEKTSGNSPVGTYAFVSDSRPPTCGGTETYLSVPTLVVS